MSRSKIKVQGYQGQKLKSAESFPLTMHAPHVAKYENPKRSLHKKLKAFVGKSEKWVVSV